MPARLLALLAAAALAGAADAQPAKPSKDPAAFLHAPPKPASVKGRFTVVALGDLLYTNPQAATDDPDLQAVLDLVRKGDVAIANQEGEAFDLKTFKGEAYGHGQVYGAPGLARDYRAMGIDMVSMANNHSTDWGPEGLMDSAALLDAAGVIHAGAGRTLQEARRAGVFETPKGRVALVATASTFKVNAGANDPLDDVPGRPGISQLRTRTIRLVMPDQMARIRQLATEFASPLKPAPAPDAREVTLGEQIYRVADRTGLQYDMDLYDHAGLLKAVREAKQASDLVVFTIHAHESPTGVDDDTPEPPDFLIRLFHDALDAGADVIIGGGPHALRGVEIYKGKPVLYGMGIFVFKPQIKAMQETVFRDFPDSGLPPEPDPRPKSPPTWFQGVVAVTEFEGAKARTLRLYPIDLANPTTPGRRGLPHLAQGETAQAILAKLRADSAAFGTTIVVEGDVGVVRIP